MRFFSALPSLMNLDLEYRGLRWPSVMFEDHDLQEREFLSTIFARMRPERKVLQLDWEEVERNPSLYQRICAGHTVILKVRTPQLSLQQLHQTLSSQAVDHLLLDYRVEAEIDREAGWLHRAAAMLSDGMESWLDSDLVFPGLSSRESTDAKELLAEFIEQVRVHFSHPYDRALCVDHYLSERYAFEVSGDVEAAHGWASVQAHKDTLRRRLLRLDALDFATLFHLLGEVGERSLTKGEFQAMVGFEHTDLTRLGSPARHIVYFVEKELPEVGGALRLVGQEFLFSLLGEHHRATEIDALLSRSVPTGKERRDLHPTSTFLPKEIDPLSFSFGREGLLLAFEAGSLAAETESSVRQVHREAVLEESIEQASQLYSAGRYSEALGLLEEIMATASQLNRRDLLAEAQLSYGKVAFVQSRYDEAYRYFTGARDLYSELEEPEGLANSHHALGELHLWCSEFERAGTEFQFARELFLRSEDPDAAALGEARTLNSLGKLHLQLSQLEDAEDCFREALQLFARFDKPLGEASCHHSLGSLFSLRQDHQRALEHLTRSSSLYEQLGEPLGQLGVWHSLATLRISAKQEGVDRDLRAEVHEKIALARELGEPISLGHTYQILGYLEFRGRQPTKAIQALLESSAFFSRGHGEMGIGENLQTLVEIHSFYYFHQRQHERVLLAFRALQLAQQTHSLPNQLDSLLLLGECLRDAEESAAANGAFLLAYQMAESRMPHALQRVTQRLRADMLESMDSWQKVKVVTPLEESLWDVLRAGVLASIRAWQANARTSLYEPMHPFLESQLSQVAQSAGPSSLEVLV